MLKLKRSIIFLLLILLFYKDISYAYVDPGTGGMFYQIIILLIGAIAGYFAIVKKFFKKLFKKKDTSEKDT
jgi:hypothetical protein